MNYEDFKKQKEQTLIERLDEIKANSVTDEQYKKLWGKSIDEGVDEIMKQIEEKKTLTIMDREELEKVAMEHFAPEWKGSIIDAFIEGAKYQEQTMSELPIRNQLRKLLNGIGDCAITEEILLKNGFGRMNQTYQNHTILTCLTDGGIHIEIDLTDRDKLVKIQQLYVSQDKRAHPICYMPFPTSVNMFNLELFVFGVDKEIRLDLFY